MKTIAEFCTEHHACPLGRDWALANCQDMAEAWEKAKPEWLIWIATRPGVLDDKTLRLFACWCVRQVWHLLTDERSRHAVEVAERFARGEATQAELDAARDAAWAAARAVARDTAWAAARAVARDAAWAAARAVARDAAWDAAWAAARDAARDAAWGAQATHLRELCNPFATQEEPR